jgi:hypothetical protein
MSSCSVAASAWKVHPGTTSVQLICLVMARPLVKGDVVYQAP